jgi:hypothetical protein
MRPTIVVGTSVGTGRAHCFGRLVGGCLEFIELGALRVRRLDHPLQTIESPFGEPGQQTRCSVMP